MSGRNDGLQLTGIYQFHRPMEWNFSDRFYLHYGVGGHFGYERARNRTFDQRNFIDRNRHQFAMGIDALVGLEYHWLTVPVTIGLDLKPYFDFVGMRSTRLKFWDSAISFKYIF